AGYQNYRSQLVCEILTGNPTESFTSAAMQHGTDTEPQARAMYSMTEGHTIVEVGFVPHPTIPMSGASPDGLVGDDGLVEIKCPQPTEHIRVLTGGAIKRNYLLQMMWQMECTGRDWCDFVSFCPALPNEMQLHVQRVEKDAEQVGKILEAVKAFNVETDALVKKLQSKYLEKAA
ncbi:MAG: lambda exonuclease family protein, partial [Sulfitobacter sp.]